MSPALSTTPLTHPTADVRNCWLGAYCNIGARTQLLAVTLGDYSYIVNDSDAICATGKFCAIPAMTRINPGNHPVQRARQSHFTCRASAHFAGEPGAAEFFVRRRRSQLVASGRDVWIGRGAIVLPRRRIGTRAVIAAGTALTKELASNAIIARNRVRPIRQRFAAAIARSACGGLPGRNRSHEPLRSMLPDFRKPAAERFLAPYEQSMAQIEEA
jgi:phosphonate metabolism protein (transferase hexapeptide repeat family)